MDLDIYLRSLKIDEDIYNYDLRQVIITRYQSSIYGTKGILIIPGFEFSCYSLELPWKNNQRGISCIPKGTYRCSIFYGNKYKRVYQIHDVPDRNYILIHPANYAGDVTQGLRSDLKGCIGLGKKSYKTCIGNSRIAIREFMETLNYRPFQLTIKDLIHT